MTNDDESISAPEFQLLLAVLDDEAAAHALATAPGGWRELNAIELRALGLDDRQVKTIHAMQVLTTRSWPEIRREKMTDAETIARIYVPRLAAEKDEIVLAVALDGDGYFLAQHAVGKNTGDGFGVAPSTVLRPLIRDGAQGFVLVLNNPTGKPRATPDLKRFAQQLHEAGDAVNVLLLDVVVIGARDSGWMSLVREGVIDT